MDDSSPNGSPPPEPLWSTLPTAAHLDQLPDGTNWELKDFTMKETLGTGTFGRVRLCQHKTDGGYYAMKVCRDDMLTDNIFKRSSFLSSYSTKLSELLSIAFTVVSTSTQQW